MPGALTHTRITWALSPMAPQVPGVTPESPLCPWCFGHSSWRGARQMAPKSVTPWAQTLREKVMENCIFKINNDWWSPIIYDETTQIS